MDVYKTQVSLTEIFISVYFLQEGIVMVSEGLRTEEGELDSYLPIP